MVSDFFTSFGPLVLGGALFMAAAWVFAYGVDRTVDYLCRTRTELDSASAKVMARIVRYSILVFAAIVVLDGLGVEVVGLIAALGIFGFALGLGLRTTTNNFFTGIMLFTLKPYGVGDHIEGERVEGVVESMDLFHTVVVTKEGDYVAVPNGAMWARSIRNFSRPRPRCVDVDVTVKHGIPLAQLRTPIEETLNAEALVAKDLAPLIRISEEKRDSLVIRAAFWCDPEHEHAAYKRVSDALRANLAAAGATVLKIAKMRKKKPTKGDDSSAPASAPPSQDVD